MKLVVDGIFFQIAQSGIARVWATLIPLLRARGVEIVLLDRGGCPADTGAQRVPFPSYRFTDTAADSLLLEQMCEHLKADLFASTYYTTPTRIPSVVLVYDMIPELFDFDLTHRDWMEKELAILYATAYVCISHSTSRDLRRLYPEIGTDRVTVAHCGVDHATFKPGPRAAVDAFRHAHDLARRYFLFVGSRNQHLNYKNSQNFFDALVGWERQDFDVLCVGGEPDIDAETAAKIPPGVRATRVSLSDADLALAYTDAEALIYPSLYEGFGLPVVEAMACGCPVITTRAGSLPEVTGDAALLVSGRSAPEMRLALEEVVRPAVRRRLRDDGLRQAAHFRWETMADTVAQVMRHAVEVAGQPAERAFRDDWARLRREQARVDFLS